MIEAADNQKALVFTAAGCEKQAAERIRRRREADLMGRYAELTDLGLRLQQAQFIAPAPQEAQMPDQGGDLLGGARNGVKMLEGYIDDLLRILDAYAGSAAAHTADERVRFGLQRIRSGLALALQQQDMPALLQQSREGMRRIDGMARDLKNAVLGADTKKWRCIDLHHQLDAVLATVRKDSANKAAMRREYGVIPQIECLPEQLSRAFRHLIANADDAVAGRSRGMIVVRTGSQNDRVWVEISDNGAGIAPDDRKRIFHPFFTTKPAGAGLGLGLPMAADIIHMHGGEIQAAGDPAGRPRAGSTFRVILPQRQSERR